MNKPTSVDDFRRFLGLPEHLSAHLQGWWNEIAQWEREECATAADGVHDHADCGHGEGYMNGRHDAAAAIRARA